MDGNNNFHLRKVKGNLEIGDWDALLLLPRLSLPFFRGRSQLSMDVMIQRFSVVFSGMLYKYYSAEGRNKEHLPEARIILMDTDTHVRRTDGG
jgi:hypothetical protein